MGTIINSLAIVTSLVVLGVVCLTCIGISLEKKGFNGGNCPICGNRMKLFDHDSQGGRGYCCHNCNYHTWVSYKTVDRNFNEEVNT